MRSILTVPFELKALREREFEGYGSVFGNTDLGDDVVMPGAFTKSLKRRMPKFYKQHNPDWVPGVWTAVSEDSHGLHVKGRFIDTTLGRDSYIEVKEGAVDGLSIGYRTIRSEGSRPRKLKELELWEVSLVSMPMNEEALVSSIKQFWGRMPESKRDLEEFLRDVVGMSRTEAKTAISIGNKIFKTDNHDDDPGGMPDGQPRDAATVAENDQEALKQHLQTMLQTASSMSVLTSLRNRHEYVSRNQGNN